MQTILALVGATASGKTDLLEALFGPRGPFAGRAEVVSADSMQAYRGMDIGTAKPGPELLSSLPHHLLDIRDPDEQFTAGDFVRLAEEAILDILSRGRLPVVAGGTGFYLRNLLLGLPRAPAAEPALRAAVAADLERLGPEGLRAELAAGDPASAARIHPKDLYRLTRALEILRATGRPMADFLPAGLHGREGPPRREGPLGAATRLLVHYRRGREELEDRIARRVELMFEAGLPGEVARLRAAGYGREAPGMKAIGYSEFFELEEEGLSGQALLAAAASRIVLDTKRYAKRQETYFRGLERDLRASSAPAGAFPPPPVPARGALAAAPAAHDEGRAFPSLRVELLEARSPEADAAALAALLAPFLGAEATHA